MIFRVFLTLFICLFVSSVGAEQEATNELDGPEAIPSRMPLPAYSELLKKRAGAAVFKTQHTPARDSFVSDPDTVELTLSFNHPMTVSSLPPSVNSWSLQTPWGLVDRNNIAEFGTVDYSSLPRSEDGKAYPPNTLRFRLQAPQPATKQLDFSLSLSAAPLDSAGRRVNDFQEDMAYQDWSFAFQKPEPVDQDSGMYLILVDPNSQESWVLTSLFDIDIASPDGAAVVTLTESAPPHSLPHITRVFRFKLPSLTASSEEQIYTLGSDEIEASFTELFYAENHLLTESVTTPTETREWMAKEGTLKYRPRTSLNGRVDIDLKLFDQDGVPRELTGFFFFATP